MWNDVNISNAEIVDVETFSVLYPEAVVELLATILAEYNNSNIDTRSDGYADSVLGWRINIDNGWYLFGFRSDDHVIAIPDYRVSKPKWVGLGNRLPVLDWDGKSWIVRGDLNVESAVKELSESTRGMLRLISEVEMDESNLTAREVEVLYPGALNAFVLLCREKVKHHLDLVKRYSGPPSKELYDNINLLATYRALNGDVYRSIASYRRTTYAEGVTMSVNDSGDLDLRLDGQSNFEVQPGTAFTWDGKTWKILGE